MPASEEIPPKIFQELAKPLTAEQAKITEQLEWLLMPQATLKNLLIRQGMEAKKVTDFSDEELITTLLTLIGPVEEIPDFGATKYTTDPKYQEARFKQKTKMQHTIKQKLAEFLKANNDVALEKEKTAEEQTNPIMLLSDEVFTALVRIWLLRTHNPNADSNPEENTTELRQAIQLQQKIKTPQTLPQELVTSEVDDPAIFKEKITAVLKQTSDIDQALRLVFPKELWVTDARTSHSWNLFRVALEIPILYSYIKTIFHDYYQKALPLSYPLIIHRAFNRIKRDLGNSDLGLLFNPLDVVCANELCLQFVKFDEPTHSVELPEKTINTLIQLCLFGSTISCYYLYDIFTEHLARTKDITLVIKYYEHLIDISQTHNLEKIFGVGIDYYHMQLTFKIYTQYIKYLENLDPFDQNLPQIQSVDWNVLTNFLNKLHLTLIDKITALKIAFKQPIATLSSIWSATQLEKLSIEFKQYEHYPETNSITPEKILMEALRKLKLAESNRPQYLM